VRSKKEGVEKKGLGSRRRAQNGGIVAVAIHAFGGSIFVDHDRFVANPFALCMAVCTSDVGMAAGKSKVRARIVIEQGRNPALGIVAIDATRLAVFRYELRIMRVVVASFALRRSALEARFVAGGGLVAFPAGNSAVNSQ